MVCLKHPGEYPMNEGRIVSNQGLNIAHEDYEENFVERQVKQSNALHSVRIPGESYYLVGPLARVNLCFDQLSPAAKRAAETCRVEWPCFNNFKSIIARAIELIDACEESLQLIRSYEEPALSRAPFAARPGQGVHATEAPRGLLYHRYRIGDDGLIGEAKIVPPTAQNLGQMESDLRGFVPTVLNLDDAAATRRCEHMIRNYDPCISCATHFLKLTIDRGE